MCVKCFASLDFFLILKIKYFKSDDECFPELILPHDLSKSLNHHFRILLCMRRETAILVVALEEDKALENGRTLEMFVGKLCKIYAVQIKN